METIKFNYIVGYTCKHAREITEGLIEVFNNEEDGRKIFNHVIPNFTITNMIAGQVKHKLLHEEEEKLVYAIQFEGHGDFTPSQLIYLGASLSSIAEMAHEAIEKRDMLKKIESDLKEGKISSIDAIMSLSKLEL